MKNIAIIGGGVAGLSAAIYALRANVNVTMFEQFGLGGLVATLDKIENYP
ncbi:MAG: FAD-dependent oxidoreductase, partial [Clostridia bacterium]|nr:FAD-dependent oxidoreductase [Clostridia bacterium]